MDQKMMILLAIIAFLIIQNQMGSYAKQRYHKRKYAPCAACGM